MTSISGRRSAAISGGRIALRSAITAAATKAPPKLSTSAPGTIHAAIEQRRRGEHPRDDEADRPDPRSLGRPDGLLAVGRGRHPLRPSYALVT